MVVTAKDELRARKGDKSMPSKETSEAKRSGSAARAKRALILEDRAK